MQRKYAHNECKDRTNLSKKKKKRKKKKRKNYKGEPNANFKPEKHI